MNQLKKKIYNHLMCGGNKETCEKLFFKSLKLIQKKSNKDHKKIIKTAFINSSPLIDTMQIKRRRKQIKEFPFLLLKHTRVSLAIKFIRIVAKKNSELIFYKKFKEELILSSKNKGGSIKNKENLQIYAFSTKKYSYFKWF